jgi:hypothetical protein
MKTLLALFVGALVMAMAGAAPARAATASPLRCLALNSGLASYQAYDVCKCVVVRVDRDVRKLLKPDPVKISTLCRANAGGGGGGLSQVSDSPNPPEQGHGFSFSKASSTSGVLSVGIVISSTPVAVTVQGQKNDSVVIGDGSAQANAGSTGGATAGATSPGGVALVAPSSASSSAYASGGGGTSGSTCAGSACGGGLSQ